MKPWYFLLRFLKLTTDEEQAESLGNSVIVFRDILDEHKRVGFQELHSIAAVTGSVAAQEVIKLITQQYVPINGTWIFNGIQSQGATYGDLLELY